MSLVQTFMSQSQHSKRTTSENDHQQNQPLTSQSIKFYDDPSKQELVQLKEQMKQKDQQLTQKNQIIKQLQERCMLVDAYERKIQNLQNKASKLQQIIDRLQKNGARQGGNKDNVLKKEAINQCGEYEIEASSALKQTNKNKSTTSLTSKQKIAITNQNKTKSKQSNKENRKSSLKMKENTKITDAINEQSRSKSKDKSKQKRISINAGDVPASLSCKNIQQIVSSKCLNVKKQDPLKFQQIQKKFSKMKENMTHNTTSSKPRSSKSIQQIYSIINNHKIRGQGFVVKQINQKLQNILDQSERLSNGASGSVKEKDLSFSYNNKHDYQWKNEKDKLFSQMYSHRPRSDSYSFQNSFVNSSFSHRPCPDTRQSRHVQFDKRNTTYCNDVPRDAFSKMDSRKFAHILNSTSVQQMMRGKKSFSGLNLPIKGSYNKTFDSHTDRFTASKVFWKREI